MFVKVRGVWVFFIVLLWVIWENEFMWGCFGFCLVVFGGWGVFSGKWSLGVGGGGKYEEKYMGVG